MTKNIYTDSTRDVIIMPSIINEGYAHLTVAKKTNVGGNGQNKGHYCVVCSQIRTYFIVISIINYLVKSSW